MKLIIFLLFVIGFGFTDLNSNGLIIGSLDCNTASLQLHSMSESAEAYEGDDDFSPGLFFFALIGAGFILASVGAGAVLTVLGLLIVFGLISLGALSASVIVGLNKRSLSKGFKTFIVLVSTVNGVVIAIAGFLVLNQIVHWWSTETAVVSGLAVGAIAGLGFGYVAFYILQRLTAFFRKRLSLAA